MELSVIFYRNEKIDAFTTPLYSDKAPEVDAKQLSRALRICNDVKMLKSYSDLKMYHIGSFNDETGELKPIKPVLLVDLGKIVDVRLKELDDERTKENA